MDIKYNIGDIAYHKSTNTYFEVYGVFNSHLYYFQNNTFKSFDFLECEWVRKASYEETIMLMKQVFSKFNHNNDDLSFPPEIYAAVLKEFQELFQLNKIENRDDNDYYVLVDAMHYISDKVPIFTKELDGEIYKFVHNLDGKLLKLSGFKL